MLSPLQMSFSDQVQETISPHDQRIIPGTKKIYPSEEEIDRIVIKAAEAQRKWRKVPVSERVKIGKRFAVCIASR
jgi:acyl-CoA reductase-like NAD-dependent aldehyde dehydrogenase